MKQMCLCEKADRAQTQQSRYWNLLTHLLTTQNPALCALKKTENKSLKFENMKAVYKKFIADGDFLIKI